MTITTKFNLGDDVFCLYDNKVHKVQIYGISTEYNEHDRLIITYKATFYSSGGTTKFDESRLFATKEALLNSL